MSENSPNEPESTSAVDKNSSEIIAEPAVEAANALDRAQSELAEQQLKNAVLADQFLRAKAEADNARRRADEEISKARKFAIEGFAESLLPVVDSLETGLSILDATPDQIREGAQATLRQLLAALERNKVVVVDPLPGSKFDPHRQQAISVVPSDLEVNSVVTVLQKGYCMAERVLRPALVTVAAQK